MCHLQIVLHLFFAVLEIYQLLLGDDIVLLWHNIRQNSVTPTHTGAWVHIILGSLVLLLVLWRLMLRFTRGVPDAAAEALESRAVIGEVADVLWEAPHLLITGRGFAYPTAREGALKLIETCYLPTLAFSAADLLHGPLALLGPSLTTLALTPEGATSAGMAILVDQIAATGSPVITIGPTRHSSAFSNVFTGHHLSEKAAPIVDVIPLQPLALELARLKGINPDSPRALQQETNTF